VYDFFGGLYDFINPVWPKKELPESLKLSGSEGPVDGERELTPVLYLKPKY
jgi:hypothetical protein